VLSDLLLSLRLGHICSPIESVKPDDEIVSAEVGVEAYPNPNPNQPPLRSRQPYSNARDIGTSQETFHDVSEPISKLQ